MIRRLSLLAAILCTVVGATQTAAQVNPNLDEIGLKPYGSFEGGNIDSISLANGNLTLHAQLPGAQYPQRGTLNFPSHLSYNNKDWYVYQTCHLDVCTSQWKFA